VLRSLIFSFVLLIASIRREFVPTFFTTQTSTEFIHQIFLAENEDHDDEAKFDILANSRKKWLSISVKVNVWLN